MCVIGHFHDAESVENIERRKRRCRKSRADTIEGEFQNILNKVPNSREDDSAEKSNFYTLAIFAEVRDLKLLKRNKKRLFI